MTERSIPATEFKANCLALLDEVAMTKETLVVTKHGRPIARVLPAGERRGLIGSVTFHISDDEFVNWGSDWKDDRELTRGHEEE